MEENISNLKFMLGDLRASGYNETFLKSLEECIERIEETLCLDTIEGE